MKKKALLLLLLPLLAACDLGGINILPPTPDPVDPVDPVDPPDYTVFENEETLYNAFFSYTNKIEIELKFTNQAIYDLAKYGTSHDYNREEIYHPCNATITINGASKTFEGVGARMKGNTSRYGDFVNQNGRFDKQTDRWCHYKLSFNQLFEDNDYYTPTFENELAKTERKDRRFGTMKKIDFKWNKNFDYSYTKEAYANDCLIDAGLIAQHTNLIKLTVKSDSDSYSTNYLAMEAIDKQMLKRFTSKNEAKGNLYKCTWPVNLRDSDDIDVESAYHTPVYTLKTNEEVNDNTILANALKVINTPGSVEDIYDDLNSCVDLEYFVKYSALMWVIGNPDDMRNGTNNTYLYFNSVSNKMIPIPYDNDRCFGIRQDWDVRTEEVTYYSTKRVSQDRAWNENNLLWRTIINETSNDVYYSDDYPVIPECQELYKRYVKEYANKYLNTERYENFTNQFVHSAKNVSIPGGSNITFADYARAKTNTDGFKQL